MIVNKETVGSHIRLVITSETKEEDEVFRSAEKGIVDSFNKSLGRRVGKVILFGKDDE